MSSEVNFQHLFLEGKPEKQYVTKRHDLGILKKIIYSILFIVLYIIFGFKSG